MTTITDHDAYIAAAPELFRPLLGRLRGILALALPDAEEIVAATKTGITFSPRKPIPDDLVERLARASRTDAGA